MARRRGWDSGQVATSEAREGTRHRMGRRADPARHPRAGVSDVRHRLRGSHSSQGAMSGANRVIRTLSAPVESVTYRFQVASVAVNARVAVGPYRRTVGSI